MAIYSIVYPHLSLFWNTSEWCQSSPKALNDSLWEQDRLEELHSVLPLTFLHGFWVPGTEAEGMSGPSLLSSPIGGLRQGKEAEIG